jgi:hypothetical protein
MSSQKLQIKNSSTVKLMNDSAKLGFFSFLKGASNLEAV